MLRERECERERGEREREREREREHSLKNINIASIVPVIFLYTKRQFKTSHMTEFALLL